MANNLRGAQWTSFQRCLAIVRRLQEGPASKAQLMCAVRESVPPAYGPGALDALRKKFERDIQNVREQLGVAAPYDRRSGLYSLGQAGPWLSVGLSPEALRGLALLLNTFDEASAAGEVARPLLEAIQRLLPPDLLRQLERHNPAMEIDLRDLEQGEIPPQVWNTVRRAIAERRVLQFDYISPGHDPPERRTHVVEPYPLKFQDGHWRLLAFCRRWSGARELQEPAGWLTYRLSRIQPDGLEVWPDKFPPTQRRRRLVPLQYRLGPALHRGGVSPRFEDMQVSPVEEDGWVTVTTRTDDLFAARRILLGYGENCRVLAPPELRREMAAAARMMAEFYKDEEIPPP
jgi:predicted DNA-binding transcriptional regulator YafY